MTAPLERLADLELADAFVVADPYPYYEALRQAGTVHWNDSLFGGAWLFLGFDDVKAMLRDWASLSSTRHRAIVDQLGSGEAEAAQPLVEMHSRWMIFFDPPKHTRLRRIMARGFSREVLAALARVVADGAREAAELVRSRGRVDLVEQVAEKIPLLVISTLLGVPGSDRDRFLRWTSDIAMYMGSERPDQATIAAAQTSLPEFQDYFDAVVEERRSSPRQDDLLSLLVADPDEELLSREELFAQATLLLFAGLETTKNLIASALLCMIQNPRAGELVVGDPERARDAIEEVLRLESPVQFARRVAARDFEHGGVRIARGDIAALLIGAANRDPARFDAPHEFRVERDPAGGLSFGFGRHACLGQNLARIEAELTVATLLREVPELLREPSVEFTWQRSPGFRGLARLDVDLS